METSDRWRLSSGGEVARWRWLQLSAWRRSWTAAGRQRQMGWSSCGLSPWCCWRCWRFGLLQSCLETSWPGTTPTEWIEWVTVGFMTQLRYYASQNIVLYHPASVGCSAISPSAKIPSFSRNKRDNKRSSAASGTSTLRKHSPQDCDLTVDQIKQVQVWSLAWNKVLVRRVSGGVSRPSSPTSPSSSSSSLIKQHTTWRRAKAYMLLELNFLLIVGSFKHSPRSCARLYCGIASSS